jgi:hypothetical protein
MGSLKLLKPMRLVLLFLLSTILLQVQAQQHNVKGLIQGTWHLTTSHTELEWHFQGRNKCTIDVAEDSLLILVFKNDTMLKITPRRYQSPDTALYIWEIKNDLIRFWLPNVKRRKQITKYLSVASLTNFELKIWQSLHDHSSVINSYAHLDLTFTKENNVQAEMLQKLYFGDWFITDNGIKNIKDFANSPLIKLQRDTHYLDTTSHLNSCKEVTHEYLNYRLLSISEIGEAAFHYVSDTITIKTQPCNPNGPQFESWTYPIGRSIDYSSTVTVFYKSRQIRLIQRDGTSTLFKFDRLGDTLILTKVSN